MENNYLVDRETLGQFVDVLIAKKYGDQVPVDSSDLRERSIKQLDESITNAVFGNLNLSQLDEVNAIVENGDSAEAFMAFFENAGIDVKQKISDAMSAFSAKFLEEQ